MQAEVAAFQHGDGNGTGRQDAEVVGGFARLGRRWRCDGCIFRFALRSVAFCRIGGRGSRFFDRFGFETVEGGEAAGFIFENGRIGESGAIGLGEGFGEEPAFAGGLRALQDEHGRAQEDGGGGSGVIEDGEQGFHGAVAEVVEIVAAGEDKFRAGLLDGGDEAGMSFQPAIDGSAMEAGFFGGSGDGGSGGQG